MHPLIAGLSRRSSFLIQFATLVLLVGGASAALLALVFQLRSRESLREVELGERLGLENQAQRVVAEVQRVAADARLVAKLVQLELKRKPTADEFRAWTATHFRLLLASRPRYDHVRLLGLRGEELVRVNNTPHGPQLIGDPALQQKGHRYCFLHSVFAEQGQMYVSPLDLNVEHGKIQQVLHTDGGVCHLLP